jgi:dihydrofolate reductase
VYGGSSFVASLIERNLIDEYHLLLDEYHLLLNPVVLESGLTISKGLADTLRLTLVTSKAFLAEQYCSVTNHFVTSKHTGRISAPTLALYRFSTGTYFCG